MGVVAILVMWPGQFEHIFVPSGPEGSTWNLVTTGCVAFEEMFKIVILQEFRAKGHIITMISSTSSLKKTLITTFNTKIFKSFNEILCISIFPYLTLPYERSKSTQGHHLNNLIFLVVLAYTMLHTKFKAIGPLVLDRMIFLYFLPYMGMAAILVMWPNSFI